MNTNENNNNLDELITNTIGRDGLKFDFNKWKNEHKKEVQIYKSQTTSGKAPRSAEPPNIWRIIMNNKITKLTTAAMLILAVLLGIILIDKSATPAYAIDQTIQAMRSVSSMI